jgi:hypothetical protein
MTSTLRVSRRAVALCGVGVGLFLIFAPGCEVRHVELGARSGDDGGPAPLALVDPSKGSAYGCGDWIDSELNALRFGACEGFCDGTPGRPYDLDGKAPIMAATAGRWAFCSGHLGPPDAVGIELGPGCRVFFLRYDAENVAVRGTEAAYQADYDILDPRPEGAPAQIDLHLSPTHTLTMDIDAYRCPERVHLRYGDQALDLARFDGHGGTGLPVR